MACNDSEVLIVYHSTVVVLSCGTFSLSLVGPDLSSRALAELLHYSSRDEVLLRTRAPPFPAVDVVSYVTM